MRIFVKAAVCAGVLAAWVGGQVHDLVIVSKTHFDIGYTGLASEVIQRYRTGMIDKALSLMDSSNSLPKEQRFIWTVPGWPLRKILENWPGQTAARQERIRNAFRQGRIKVHALPYSLHTESLDEEDLVRGLGFSSSLAREFAQALPKSAKMTDVPSHSWILPTLLKQSGVDFLHIGCNPASSTPDLPRLFLWEGPDGSRLLTWYDKEYGSTPYPPTNWPITGWMNMAVTGDNHGPPTNAEMQALLAGYQAAGKQVMVGGMDDVLTLLLAKGTAGLPVIRGDMPDTWIHGIGTMPRESKLARSLRSSSIPALDALNTMLCLQGITTADERATIAEAYDHSLRFAEHTWGLSDPFEDYGDKWLTNRRNGAYQRMENSWSEKGAEIRAARDRVDPALAGKLGALAKAAPIAGKRITVFNPLPWKRRGAVSVPWIGAAPAGVRDPVDNKILPASLQTGELHFIAEDVPPMGFRSYAVVAAGAAPLADSVRADASARILENARFRITLAPAAGGVASILDKSTGKELIDGAAPEQAAGRYLNERFGRAEVDAYVKAYSRMQGGWALDDFGKTGLPSSAYRMDKAAGMSLRFEGDALRRTAILSAGPDSRHAGMELRVTLHSGMPHVDFRWSVQSRAADPWPESEWLAFPLRISNPGFRLQRTGGLVDPARDLVRGSNQDLFALSGGLAVFAADGSGVGLCSRDLPLVSLDRPGSWKYSRDFVPQRPNVYFQLYNNQWDTNFQQWFEGSWSAEVRLWPVQGFSADTSLVKPAAEVRSPLLAALADGAAGNAPEMSAGVSVGRPGVMVTSFGANPDGSGTLLRLWELAGRDGPCPIQFPPQMGVVRVQPVNLRGEPVGGALPVTAGRFVADLPHNRPLSLRLEYERCQTPIRTAREPGSARPPRIVLNRLKVSGPRFLIPPGWAGLKVVLDVHDFRGRRMGSMQVSGPAVDLQSALGLGDGIYFIRVTAP